MADGLSCSVCYQDYNLGERLPKALICGHTFCESCVNAIENSVIFVNEHNLIQNEVRVIRCPLCVMSSLQQSIDEVSRNYELANYFETNEDLYLERCRKCFKAFQDENPALLLTCGHTQCGACVDKTREDYFTDNVWICPFCPRLTRLPAERWPPKNYALETMQTSHCDVCQVLPCRIRCEHCTEALCVTCSQLQPHSDPPTLTERIKRVWYENRKQRIILAFTAGKLLQKLITMFLYLIFLPFHMVLRVSERAWSMAFWPLTCFGLTVNVVQVFQILITKVWYVIFFPFYIMWRLTAVVLSIAFWPLKYMGVTCENLACNVILVIAGIFMLALFLHHDPGSHRTLHSAGMTWS